MGAADNDADVDVAAATPVLVATTDEPLGVGLEGIAVTAGTTLGGIACNGARQQLAHEKTQKRDKRSATQMWGVMPPPSCPAPVEF